MKENTKNFLGISLSVGVLIFAFSAFMFAGSFAKSSDPARTFSVSAEGEVVAIPDIVEFNYSVITEGGEDLVALQEESSQKVNDINNYLRDQGINEEDIRTLSHNISPRYQSFPCPMDRMEPCPPREIVGYTINHSVQVKVRDLSTVGEILSGVVSAGANSTSGLNFSIDDVDEIRNEARDLAIEKAKNKAEAIADSAGFRLGKIVSINESISSPYYPIYRDSIGVAEMDMATAPSAPSIEPGEQEIRVNVSISYEIR